MFPTLNKQLWSLTASVLLIALPASFLGCKTDNGDTTPAAETETLASEAIEALEQENAEPATADDEQPDAETLAAGMPEDPLEGAKWAMRKMSNLDDPLEAVEMLTNSSAAALGTVLLMPLGMMAAMTDNRELAGEIDELLADYELPAKHTLWADEPIAAIEPRGRELFSDLVTLLEKHRPEEAEDGDMPVGGMDIDEEMEHLSFEVKNDTTVKIVHAKEDESFEVRLEGGKWRLHLGNLEDIREQMELPTEPPEMPAQPGGHP